MHVTKIPLLALVALALVSGAAQAKPKAKSAPKKDSTAEAPPVDPHSDYDAMGVLTRNCAGCHQTAGHPGALFLNRSRLSEPQTLDLLIDVLEKREMPPAHKKFRESADGKVLISWLKAERARVGKTPP